MQDSALKQCRLMSKKYRLYNSLTAGLDSRFSIALTHEEAHNQRYFTYHLGNKTRNDARIASRIAATLDLNHYVILPKAGGENVQNFQTRSKVVRPRTNDKLVNKVKKWDWYAHQPKLIGYYKQMIAVDGDQDSKLAPMHIRSNLYEIGRAFFGRIENNKAPTSEFMKKIRTDWVENFQPEFNRYFSETQIDHESCFGLNLLDIFYWEHRCGTWVNEVVQGTDFAFNTVSYINSRRNIANLLSASYFHRMKSTVLHHSINNLIPELQKIKIN